jgi:histone H3/H4
MGAPKKAKKETLIIASKMKETVRAIGCMSSADLLEALSEKVHDLLREAAARAKSNGRSTIKPHDL